MDSDDTEEEFFEALESQDSFEECRRSPNKMKQLSPPHIVTSEVSSGTEPGWGVELEHGRSGVLKRCGDLVLIATGEPLYVPITQVGVVYRVISAY